MKKVLIALSLMVMFSFSLLAQTTNVTGMVTDANDGSPIPGVSVFVKGTTIGTVTNAEGKYSLGVPNDAQTIVFSFVGMTTKEIAYTGQSTLDAVLEGDAVDVGEVVVTALGIKREKKALGYAVTEMNTDELIKSREANIVNAMAGKVAGVQITSSSGQAGSSSRIVIRGNSSINYNNQPLFVIDGIPFENNESSIKSSLSYGGGTNSGIDIDPNNIETMTVLKGASASALYGSRAANGVVIITTKSGQKGDNLTVNVSHTTSLDKIIETPLQNTWAQGWYEINDGSDATFTYADGDNIKTSWSWGPRIDDTPEAKRYNRWDVFETGVTNETNVSLNGGGKKATYFASFSNLDQDGTLSPIEFNRRNLLAKFTIDLTEKLRVSTSVNYINTQTHRLMEGNDPAAFMNSFLGSPLTWNMYPATYEDGSQRVYRSGGRNNYVWLMDNSGNPSERNRFLNTFDVSYKFNDKLSFVGRIGQDFYKSQEEFYVNQGATGGHSVGTYNVYNRTFSNLNTDLMLNYSTELSDDLNLDAMLGMNITDNEIKENGINGKQYIVPDFYNINNCMSQLPWSTNYQKRSVSWYTSLTASYKNFLYYTFTGRMDKSSTLPKDNNQFFYMSNSLGLVFSELMEDKSVLSYGKLRVSYASVGNDAPAYSTVTGKVVPEPYDPYRGYIQYPFNGVGGFIESSLQGNNELKPEMTDEFEIGLEAKFFNDRLGVDAAYYNKVSKDQIVRAPIDNSTGFDSRMINIGKMTNKGVELMLYGTPVKTGDFSWDVTLNWSKNDNVVDKIADGVSSIQLNGFTGEGPYIVEGQPYGVLWGTKVARDNQWRKVVNEESGRWLVDETRPGVVGDVNPNWIGGIRNTLNYKGFSVSAFIDIKNGGQVFNLDEHYLMYYGMSTLTEDRPQSMQVVLDGPTGSLDSDGNVVLTGEQNSEAIDYGAHYRNHVSNITEEMVQKTDFIKLREVSLSYNFPQSILSRTNFIKGCNISLTGRNLWIKKDDSFTGADPEGSLSGSGNGQGIINYMMPSTKTFTASIKLTF
ncbi:MAG: SusC/RagA family TonB-linked outer membrane protein [Carboxylicivirga sp.]|jgi:TonB-linked SusC/RagA family outer membrane protein|nr:SusC/RagA family TonB-linked outer membrane protein [Carboxylicivirga sp.]